MNISQSTVPPAKYITGVVLKKNDKKKLGISFVSKPDDKDVYIRKVKGKFRKYTDLVPCLKVLSVNGQMVSTAMEAADIIRQTPNGQHVQVIAGGSCTVLKKESRFSSSSSLGISLEQIPQRKDLVRISSIDRGNCLLSGLEVGNILLSINGRSITSVSQASLLLRVNKSLTLISVRPQSCHEGLPLKPTLEQQLQILDKQDYDYDDDYSERAAAVLGELHLLPPQHDDQEQRTALGELHALPPQHDDQEQEMVLQQDPPTSEEDERLTEKQHPTTETHSLPLNEENLRRQHQDEQEHLPEHPRAESRISIASSDASGLPDAILNLQTQNHLKDEALASFLSGLGGPMNVRPLLFTEERDEAQELEDEEDLQSFLTLDTKEEEEEEEEDTVVGEFEYFSTKNIFNESLNFFRSMETVVIETKKTKKKQERQPQEEEEEQGRQEGEGEEEKEEQEQEQVRQEGRGEEGEEEKEEYPSLFVADEDGVADEDEDYEVELVVEEQPRAIKTERVWVPEKPPAQVHIHHLEEDSHSFLTEEEKDEYILETLRVPLPTSKQARTPKSTPKANKKSQSPMVLQDEEDDYTIVGETEYTPSRSIFTKGYKLFQEFVFDAASCEKPSNRYNTYDDTTPMTIISSYS
jgi:hypothetical protein